MRRSRMLGMVVAALPLVAVGGVTSEAAAVDCAGMRVVVEDVKDATGTAFVGIYRGSQGLPEGGWKVTFTVEQVYAGQPLPDHLVATSDACDSLGLRSGARYLFSTSHIERPGTSNSVAWRVFPDGSVRPVAGAAKLYRTFKAALAAIAPGAGSGLPPTDTSPQEVGTTTSGGLLLASVFLLAFVMLAWHSVDRPATRPWANTAAG